MNPIVLYQDRSYPNSVTAETNEKEKKDDTVASLSLTGSQRILNTIKQIVRESISLEKYPNVIEKIETLEKSLQHEKYFNKTLTLLAYHLRGLEENEIDELNTKIYKRYKEILSQFPFAEIINEMSLLNRKFGKKVPKDFFADKLFKNDRFCQRGIELYSCIKDEKRKSKALATIARQLFEKNEKSMSKEVVDEIPLEDIRLQTIEQIDRFAKSGSYFDDGLSKTQRESDKKFLEKIASRALTLENFKAMYSED